MPSATFLNKEASGVEQSKKQTFLHGAALLALATALVKVIGAFYKIPLKMIIGEDGFGYFNTAYQIYNVLLAVSTAGLPIAMSRMVSQASTPGNHRQVKQVYRIARTVFLLLGSISTALMLLGCKWLAGSLMRQPDAWMTVLCLAPSCLLIGLMSVYRGFFQGQSDMRPTSVSQVIEAFIRLIVGLGAAFLLMKLTGSVPVAAAGAIVGVTVSCGVSCVYLKLKQHPTMAALTDEGKAEPKSKTLKKLLAIAVPITIGSAGLYLLTMLETSIYMGRLLEALGLSQNTADHQKGIYNFAQTIFNMPTAFIVPITISALPAITSFLTLKDDKSVRATEESAARVTGLISLPCTVGLFLLARPIMALLGRYSGEKLTLATALLQAQSISVFLYAVIQYTNCILQSHDKAGVPVIHILLCGAAKLFVVYLLVGNAGIGLVGAPISTALSYACICVLNLLAIRRYVPQRPELLKNLLRSLAPAAIMGIAVYATIWLLGKFTQSSPVLCAGGLVVGVVVYAVCVVLFKAITAEDCRLLPKGEKIARLLHL